MVFVTVGSQKFPFDRLLRAVDELAARGDIDCDVFAQTGSCAYVPQNIEWQAFLSREEFAEKVGQADVIVTHGGTGAIVGALKRGKRVVAVPRLACHGEHVDDHQVEIVETFAARGYIVACLDEDDLASAYTRALCGEYCHFESNSDVFIADLDRYLESCRGM